jgi:energy-coupling factor transporter ATP-binding protein EcfA2
MAPPDKSRERASSMTPSPTIFDSFNARSLDPSQVAATFVPSLVYKKLIKRRHTIIVGPRGSGKTTLLKMLQQMALEYWSHEDADEYRSRIDFTGVFIPTDLIWSEQLRSLGFGLDDQTVRLLGNAAFTTQVLRALTSSMLDRIRPSGRPGAHQFRRVKLSPESESGLAAAINDAWHLKTRVPSLLAIEQALSVRMLRIYEIASKEALLGRESRRRRLAETDFLQLHFLQSAAVAIDVFNDLADERDGKWALAFDELELAPEWIQDELVKLLRSTDQRFIFKLAMSPLTHATLASRKSASPSAGQDFDQIALWYPNKRDAYAFCEELWNSMLSNGKYPRKPPQEVLGSSFLHSTPDDWSKAGGAYGYGTRLFNTFKNLSKVDASFRRYLKNKRIDLNKIEQLDESKRAANIRKIVSLVVLREFYRTQTDHDAPEVRFRSRKTNLYTGAEALFAISEGNPRWFIGITENLLDRWKDVTRPIEDSIQADEITKAARRYLAMLATIPTTAKPVTTLLQILESIGTFFYDQAVRADFVAEPPATFIVDNAVPREIVDVLEPAVNSGAIVLVPEHKGEAFVSDLRGKRFRVSYLLGPVFKLPLRLGRATSLSRILILNKANSDSQLGLEYEND